MQSIKYPFPVKQISIHDGIDIAYCDEGKHEQTILFVHGLANYFPAWKHQVEALKKDFRCIAIDLPGNGLSSKGHFPYSMFFYAECIVKFIEKMELNHVTLCGHSMGGQIAMIIALRHPHLIKKLVLIAPAGLEYFSQHEIMMMQHTMNMGDFFYSDEYHLENTIKQSFYTTKNESGNMISDLKQIMKLSQLKEWKEMCLASVNGMLKEQINQFLPNIACPVLIIFGEKDQLIPNSLIHFGETPGSVAKYAAAVIPDATVCMIKNAGHFVHIEKCSEVNDEIKRFEG